MIELIAPGWYGAFDELHEMHRLRYHVLKERLGWKVCTAGGFEIDSLEAVKPHYLVLRCSAGRVEGGVRPLPSTGPKMLPDVFSTLLEGRTTPGYGFAHRAIPASRRMAARPDRSAPDNRYHEHLCRLFGCLRGEPCCGPPQWRSCAVDAGDLRGRLIWL
ncbi:acyl-homoserine-lactone synthase [Mesorhizobium sp. WSM3864]|uniref:acyl-homoserine-lactone synthase n=1 Tax=Mesorhizobium sp. WSM3864 TaxID=2029404 RepID=UPI0026975CC5